ncbi:MAG: lytic transglycosylase domain-containing protein [Bdellovibrionales bacterium]|nr:lytic transglycosylase domain-containing protein [Bdellovibrionales bacterium]
MRKRSRTALAALLVVSYAVTAGAGSIRFTREGLNARESMDFRRSSRNILGTVPAGTEGDIVGRFKLPSGNYAIQLEISKIDESKTRLKPKQKIWVYYHNDAELRRVALYDDAGKLHDNAVDGTWAVALNSFKVEVAKPETEKEKTDDHGGTPCSTCNVDGSQVNTAPITNSEISVTSEIVDQVEEDNSDAPILDPTVEEIATFIGNVQKANPPADKSLRKDVRGQKQVVDVEENREKARLIIAECKAQDVPIELVLGMIATETKGWTNVQSSKGARGLMQIMPATYNDATHRTDYDALFDLKTNIHLGVGEIAGYLKKYKNDVRAALSAYNWGPGNYDKYVNNTCKHRKGYRDSNGRCQIIEGVRDYYDDVSTWRDRYVTFNKTRGAEFANFEGTKWLRKHPKTRIAKN